MRFALTGTSVRIVGTMHKLPQGQTLPGWVQLDYEWAEEVYLECDPQFIHFHTALPKDTTLEQKIGADLYRQLDAVWRSAGARGELARLKPWVALVMLPFLGRPVVDGLEDYIRGRIAIDGKPIQHLETAAEFAALADGIADSVYVEAIRRYLSNVSYYQDTPNHLLTAWLTMRPEAIQALVPRTILGEMPEFAEPLIYRRNREWMQKIIEATKSNKRTLIGVGALHLPGVQGILALAKRAGFDWAPAF
jgi:uncharacterized protein YbaP (TraB family)